MKVYLNNAEISIELKENLATFLANQSLLNQTGIAVAINENVIPKVNWVNHILQENDKIMLITATAGG